MMMCVVIVGCGLLWPDSNENAKDKKITAALPFSRNRENAISNFVSPIHFCFKLFEEVSEAFKGARRFIFFLLFC